MKSFPKFFIAFFLIVFILQLGLLLFLALAPNTSQAADSINFKPQVIQDLDYNFDSSDKTTGNIANLVRAIYKYAIGIVGILAAVVLMIGGLLWIVAGGSSAQIGEAKAWIGASLTGLLLALLSYLILATINPALVNLKITGIQEPPKAKTEPISYTAPSYSSVTQDDSLACGEQKIGENGELFCGTKCSANQSCQKTTQTTGATKCPSRGQVIGSEAGGDWWICSSLGGGGSECCINSCTQPGYFCDTTVPQIQLNLCDNRVPNPRGICVAGAAIGGIQENQSCKGQENQCAPGLKCVGDSITKRCQKIGAPCGTGNAGSCIEDLGGLLSCGNKERLIFGSSCPHGLYCCK